MTFISLLLTVFSNTIILGGIVYLCRNSILTFFTKKLQHKYDKELLQIKAEIKEAEDQQSFIRNIALTALSTSDNYLKKLQVDSLDKLWQVFIKLKKVSGYTKTLSVLNVDEIHKGLDAGVRGLANAINSIVPTETLKNELASDKFTEGEAYRPWVSPTIWALYSTYLYVVVYVLSQLLILSLGEDVKKLLSTDILLRMLKLTITDIEVTSIQNIQLSTYLENLESNLINELQNQISGYEPDKESIKRARNVIKLSSELNLELNKLKESTE